MISEHLLAELASTHSERLGPDGLRRLADELRPLLAADLGELEKGRQITAVLAEYGIRLVLQ